MNKSLVYDFVVNKENRTISIKREFDAPVAVVWDAFTNREMLEKWWAPKPWKARTKSMDFREGGRWHYAMVGPEGEEHWGLTDYISIQKQKSFTGLDAFADAEGNLKNDMPKSTWEVTFKDKGSVTRVEYLIKYDDIAQLEATLDMGFKDGMTKAMEGLDELLASMKQRA